MDDRGKQDWNDFVEAVLKELKEKYVEPMMDRSESLIMERLRQRFVTCVESGKVTPRPAQPDEEPDPPQKKAKRSAKTDRIVKRVAIHTVPDGAVAYIDDHPNSVDLGTGATLMALFRALAEKSGSYDRHDGLVPVKSKPALMKRVKDFRGSRIVDERNLRVHIMRLRIELENACLPGGLIQTVGEFYRLRLADDGQVTLNGNTII